MKRLTTAFAAIATAALLVPAAAGAGASGSLSAAAGGAPTATASGEELATYLTTGRVRAERVMRYFFVCNAPVEVTCTVTAATELRVKGGPDVGPLTSSAQFPGGTVIEVTFRVSKKAVKVIRDNIKKVKLGSEISATRSDTGEIDVDTAVFRLKR